jgi:hypothetical protein
MAGLSGRDWRMIGCAAAIGAVVAFPAGLMLAGRDAPPPRDGSAAAPDAPAGKKAEARDFYSPKVRSDPYVLDQQRRVVEALELECRHYGRHCAEAGQARRRIKENARD